MLTKERCDECIRVDKWGCIDWPDSYTVMECGKPVTPDEAELFAYRLLDAVKRAREIE